jgi:hypothetical protein
MGLVDVVILWYIKVLPLLCFIGTFALVNTVANCIRLQPLKPFPEFSSGEQCTSARSQWKAGNA